MKFIAGILLVVLLGATAVFAGPPMVRYVDHKVYSIKVQNEQQLTQLKKFKDNLPQLFYLNEVVSGHESFGIVVDPESQQKLEDQLQYYEMEYEIAIPDLQKVIDESLPRTRGVTAMDWTKYHNLETIYNYVDNLALSNPKIITNYTIGYSYEGRPIKAIKISRKPNNKAIYVESSIHAIEWISSAASTCFFNNLLNSKDKQLRHMLLHYDWIYVPVLNPDGFIYTHEVERLWRKNRRPTGYSNSSGICYGIDLNRNFGYEWGALSAWNFDVPCDHWYGGEKPDSEPEVLALQNFINNTFPDDYIRAYVPFHSYGNFVLLPYGHTNETLPPNYDQMMRIAKGFADGAKVKYGTEFRYGSTGTHNFSGFTSGASKDWGYGVKQIPYTSTIELRDNGLYGFFLPPNQIAEVCAEVTDGMIGLVKAAEKENLFKCKRKCKKGICKCQ